MSKWMGVGALLAAMALANAASAADKLTLQLHGPASFEFAGYYAALWRGYYRDEGFDVEIKAGSGIGQASLDPVREVGEGRAQFGTGTADLVVRAGQGLPLLLLAPVFQASGAMIYYRPDSDFASPGALAKAKLGRLPASNILDIELATALRSEGLDAKKIASVPIEPAQSLDALAARRVDAIPGSSWDLPWLAREKGLQLKAADPADYRVEFYGDTLFTMRPLARREPDLVRRFRAASLKGWDYALQHPDEIASLLLSRLPHPPVVADAEGFARYQIDLAHRLARYPQIALGHSNPERWNRIEASMTATGALLRTADADEFVYDPDAAARGRTDLRSFAIIAATLVLGLAVLAWLWRRRRQAILAAGAADVAATPAAGAAAAPATPPSTAIAAVPPPPAPPLPIEPEPADLNALLSRLERRIRQRVPRRIACRLSLLPTLWRCRAEPQAVRRLVLELVAAGAADLKGPGELIVGTRNFAFDAATAAETPGAQAGEWARITVRDNGPGLAEDALARIFEPTATPRPAVAAAAETMRRLGGFARVESAEGIGTAVHLYFPRIAEAAGADRQDAPKEVAA